jgi:pantoate--beta-alanine ligase
VVETFDEVRAAGTGDVGLAPTMGYLHEGHLSLFRAARDSSDTVVASIFVNPLQFGPGDDLSRYPRDLDRDRYLAEQAGVDLLFVPSVEEMYPAPPATSIALEGLTDFFEGTHRPGHFEGVAIVVAKLFAGIQPQRAFFGRKDAQQLAVVRRLAADLSFPVEIVPVPTVREADGLALSSRNRFLSDSQRREALALSRGLLAAATAVETGERDGSTLESIVIAEVADSGLELEYVALADSATAQPAAILEADSFLAVAARAGETRLIDNVAFSVEGDSVTVDRGQTLEGPSVLEEV